MPKLLFNADCFAPDGAGGHHLFKADTETDVEEPLAEELARIGRAHYVKKEELPPGLVKAGLRFVVTDPIRLAVINRRRYLESLSSNAS